MSRISDPAGAARFFRRKMRLDIEEVWVAALTSDKKVTAAECLFRGTVDFCPAHPRDIFRFACRHNAAALVVAHNHPGGICEPSRADEVLTSSLKQALALVDVKVLDHFIVAGAADPLSFAERGLL
jgi:DNA repair protein RadC